MEAPQVSIIIPHHVGRALLERCLASVWGLQGVTYEVFVVTSDPTYVPDDARIQLLYFEEGPAAKRNLAARRARGEFLLFLDDDVEVSPYCAYEFVQWMETHPMCGMTFGKIYKMEEGRRDEFDDCGSWLTWTGFLWARASNGQRDHGQFDTSCRILASKSATTAIRRTTFTAVGGFDQDYYILGEETDLAWRVWLSGLEVWYVPTAVSWHAFGCPTLKPKQEFYTDERIFYRGCKNYLSLLWTNLGTSRLAIALPLQLSAWLCAAMGFALRGHVQRSLHIMRALRDTVGCLPHLQRKRHLIQATRTPTDRELWPLIGYSPGVSYYVNRLWRYWTTQLHG